MAMTPKIQTTRVADYSQDYFKLKTVYATNDAINIANKHDREGKARSAKGVNTENMEGI